jgi:hypothetical protein
MRRSIIGFGMIVMLLVTASAAFAQFETASVVGSVRDSSGAVVAGVKVTLTSRDTAVSLTRVTDAQGNYESVTVKPGGYVVSAEKEGFSIAIADNVVVRVGARFRVDLS